MNGRRVTPEEQHDWQAGVMPPVRRLPLRKLAVGLLVAHAAVWCAMQVYLTVDYVRSQTEIVEAR